MMMMSLMRGRSPVYLAVSKLIRYVSHKYVLSWLNSDTKLDDFYHSVFSRYHLHLCIHNAPADVSFGLLHMFLTLIALTEYKWLLFLYFHSLAVRIELATSK